MTSSRELRVRTPDDLLAIVPCVLGFHPDHSLVLLTVGGAAERFHARVDMPTDAAELTDVVGSLSSVVLRHGVERVALVIYSDDHAASLEVVGALEGRLSGLGVETVQAVRADGRRWFSLSGCVGSCCPQEGRPYDLLSHPFTAQSVLDGKVTLSSRDALSGSLLGTDPEATGLVEQAAARARRDLGLDTVAGEGPWVRARVVRYLLDGCVLSADDAGRLLVAVERIDVRDVAWAEMTRANASLHVELWRDLLRRAPDALAAAPAGLLAFAAWLDGDGALAWCAVERCQQVEPGYGLAGLLTTALANAVPPSTWRPLSREGLTLFTG